MSEDCFSDVLPLGEKCLRLRVRTGFGELVFEASLNGANRVALKRLRDEECNSLVIGWRFGLY